MCGDEAEAHPQFNSETELLSANMQYARYGTHFMPCVAISTYIFLYFAKLTLPKQKRIHKAVQMRIEFVEWINGELLIHAMSMDFVTSTSILITFVNSRFA